jgi:glycosyltransferase involved in cell wall biosynthesis
MPFLEKVAMTHTANRRDGLPSQGAVLAPEHWPSRTLSIVIPALNERINMPKVMATIPGDALAAAGYQVEVIVVDNGSTDGTGEVAADLGATVVLQPTRGYGHAYRAGFAASSGDLVATGDADCTYPFDALPDMLTIFANKQLHFMSTNRLGQQNSRAMKPSHGFGNRVLTRASRSFFRAPFRDSQSGMWLFRREIWADLDVRSGGMSFSQEIKNEAYLKGLRCAEIPIEYRVRGGDVKLNAVKDGLLNLSQLVGHRLRARRRPVTGQEIYRSHAAEISWESAFDDGTG